MAICLLVYKMSGSPQSIKNGLIDFSVKLCVSRNFEMKMTTKGKWQDEVKSDVLGSLSQDTEGVGRTDGRTDGPTSCTSSQKVRLQQWDLPWLLIDTPCLTSAGASWSILGEIYFFYPHSNKNRYNKNLKVRGGDPSSKWESACKQKNHAAQKTTT